ncbi:DUF1294 domain-containing protein [Planctomycetes bacterium K23_9]|uniref:DUF1294 domain-containing protein n=1 Tax=Stieleria marina TaxID=1930275 RepID=A0A517P328_9BACT|nr:hypothetical protein K239x_58020 [Planctomycetes bacterium K23_9]
MLAKFVVWTLVASLVTACLFIWDKRAARNSARRVSESTLLLWSLVGGWPGGLIAGRMVRHKTQKVSFRIPFVLAAITHVVAIVAAGIWYFSQ